MLVGRADLAKTIELMLTRMGHSKEDQDVANKWNELIQLTGATRTQDHDLVYPSKLLEEFVQFIDAGCRSLVLVPLSGNAPAGTDPVGATINQAWDEFNANPETFAGFMSNKNCRACEQRTGRSPGAPVPISASWPRNRFASRQSPRARLTTWLSRSSRRM